MGATVTKNGYTLFIVGTSEYDILNVLISEHYPKPVAMAYDSTGSTYHVIAYRLQ